MIGKKKCMLERVKLTVETQPPLLIKSSKQGTSSLIEFYLQLV